MQYRGGHRISSLKTTAREGRKRSTPAEAAMWACIRDRRFQGLKFRRQHQFLGFVLDFYCEELRLAIELDGAPHFEEHAIEYDTRRTERLQAFGLTVVRIENEELLLNPKIVFDRLRFVVNALQHGSS